MKYLVEVDIEGTYKVEVEATSEEAAKEFVRSDFPSNKAKMDLWYKTWAIKASEASND
jgi:hypothetical protein